MQGPAATIGSNAAMFAAPAATTVLETEPMRRRPWLADFFSGVRAPAAHALAWCGWKVTPIDMLLNSDDNIADEGAQMRLGDLCDKVDAQAWAPDCSTLSRAREIHIKGNANAPGHLEVRALCGVR